MKGIIFTGFLEFVKNTFGQEICAKARKEFGEGKVILPIEDYPDETLVNMIATVAKEAGQKVPNVLFKFGKWLVPNFLYKVYHIYFTTSPNAREFLLRMDDVHKSATKSLPGSHPPSFSYRGNRNGLIMSYRSVRRLCPFMRGLIQGVAEVYGEQITIEEKKCMLKGAPECEFHLTFA